MIRIVHPGSRIRMLISPIPDPGSRGQKSTQSRIPDPDPQHWYLIKEKGLKRHLVNPLLTGEPRGGRGGGALHTVAIPHPRGKGGGRRGGRGNLLILLAKEQNRINSRWQSRREPTAMNVSLWDITVKRYPVPLLRIRNWIRIGTVCFWVTRIRFQILNFIYTDPDPSIDKQKKLRQTMISTVIFADWCQCTNPFSVGILKATAKKNRIRIRNP